MSVFPASRARNTVEPSGSRSPWRKESHSPPTSADGFFYPPPGSSPSLYPTSSYYSNTNPTATLLPSTTSHQPVLTVNPTHPPKFMESTVPHSQFSPHHQRPPRSLPPGLLRTFALLAAFVPIPPILSLIYLLVGHAILRSTRHAPYASASLLSSLHIGATGGAILALPFALLLYILVFPAQEPDPEDFFDDDDARTPFWERRGVSYTICAALGALMGLVAGPLGVVCLPAGASLDSAHAAIAGIVGGTVVCATIALLIGSCILLWSCCFASNDD